MSSCSISNYDLLFKLEPLGNFIQSDTNVLIKGNDCNFNDVSFDDC